MSAFPGSAPSKRDPVCELRDHPRVEPKHAEEERSSYFCENCMPDVIKSTPANSSLAVKKGSGDTVKTQLTLMQNDTDVYKRHKFKHIFKRGNKLMIV